VTVETQHANLIVTAAGQISDYEQVWSLLAEMAVYGESARAVLQQIRDLVSRRTT
jgi:hypothetical protein